MTTKGRLTSKHLRRVRLRTQLSFVRNLPDTPFPERLPEKLRVHLGNHLTWKLTQAIVGAEDVTDDTDLAMMGDAVYGILPKEERKTGYHLLRLPSDDPTVTYWCEVMCTNHMTFSACGRFTDTVAVCKTLEAKLHELECAIPFAFDEQLGYLVAQLTLVGTGLRVRSWLHLSGITHFNYLNELNNAAETSGLLVEIPEGDAPPPGCLFILFNRYTLGVSSEDTARRFDHFVEQVVNQERRARERLFKDEPYLLLDRLVRAQALLSNALMVCETEVLDLFSDLRTATDVGAILKPDFDPMAEDWFEMMVDTVFSVRLLDNVAAHIPLPMSIKASAQWRLEACRAQALRPFSEFHFSNKLIRRILPQ